MKKVIVIFFILAMALGTIFLVTRPERKELVRVTLQESLGEPEKHVIVINGEEYSFLLSRYDPPFFSTELVTRDEQDLSTPEGTVLARLSAVMSNDRDWRLSLLEEDVREHNRRDPGEERIIKEHLKRMPLLDPLENYLILLFKVEFEFEGKKYALIRDRAVVRGVEQPGIGTVALVKQGDIWLGTDDAWRHPILDLVMRSYEELREILKEGTWDRRHRRR